MISKEEIIQKLIGKGFYLGGSRRMAEKFSGCIEINDDTDYDFYGPTMDETELYLMGFDLIDENSKYFDDLLLKIFKHSTYNIDVLIRKDVEIYKKCFESIGLFDYKYRLWKSNPQIPIDNKDAFKASVGAYFNYLFSKYKEDNIW